MRKFTKQITSMMALVAMGSSSCALMNSTASASANEVTTTGTTPFEDMYEIGTTTSASLDKDMYEIGTTTSASLNEDMYEIGTTTSTSPTTITTTRLIGTSTTSTTPYTTTTSIGTSTMNASDHSTTMPEGMTLRGDATCNDDVDISDAILTARVAAEDPSANITKQGRINANCDGDTKLTANDAATILRIIGRLEE